MRLRFSLLPVLLAALVSAQTGGFTTTQSMQNETRATAALLEKLHISKKDMGSVDMNSVVRTYCENLDGARVELERGEQGDLHLAYAVSIHKSQGSEFPAVVVPLLRQHSIMLARNLVYTAVTRGRKQVILVGDPTAYAMAVRNASDSRRITGLLPRLRGEE